MKLKYLSVFAISILGYPHFALSSDLTDALAKEEQRHPALRLAEEGKFAEAKKYVERGEDTEGFYKRGVQFYNYWSVRTARRDSSGKPDPSMADTLNDINDDRIKANEELVKHYEHEADLGNEEAKEWLDQYAPGIKALRTAQNTIANNTIRNEPGASSQGQNAPTQPQDGEHFPETRTQLLDNSDLQSWSTAKLRYAINEIYARHGYYFKDSSLRTQFSQFAWYQPIRGKEMVEIEAQFSDIEKKNIQLISEIRTRR